MKKELYILRVAILLLCTPLFNQIAAQDHLTVDFASPASVPDFLNICGDTDTEVVEISVDGLNTDTRSGIMATAHLFEGVEFVSFDAVNSSVGVSPFDVSDPANPIFQIPDLNPLGLSSVNIAFTVRATCAYIDTIAANNAASVSDQWEFNYDLGAITNITEFDSNIEYRDAFAIPSFTIDVNNPFGPARVGDCYAREIVTTNTGLDGFVDTIVYTNTQGPGVYVESILVNGVAVTMDKVLSGTDTLITVLIDGTQFVNNTIGMGAGDSDLFFDPNETVTITENICILDCFEDRSSFHTVAWGCDGNFCETSTVNGFADIGIGAANQVFNDAGSLPNINSGYCQSGQSTITFTNDGFEVDAGFATMMDVSAGIGLGGAFELANSGFEITGIRIAGVDIAVLETLVDLDSNAQFLGVDPDGVGGLTDFDGDGYFDDLPLNESIEITAFYEFDCSMAQDLGVDGTCDNSFSTSFNARIDHTDACDERVIRFEASYYRPSNTRSEVENFTDPDAFNLTDTFYITHTQTRGVFSFDKACSGGEQILVTVVLPPGVNVIEGATEVIRNEATSFPLISNTISNDTAYLVFDASVIPFINGDYEVILGLQADCTAPLGPTNFPLEFAHYCPDCDCKHIWFCGDMEGPQLHSTDPPCPPVACPVGLRATDFDVNRTTLGFTDETYATPIHPDSANTKVAISCDSVEMKILNVVGDTPVSDSLGMVITYNNVDGSLSTDQTFLFGVGYVRITNNGSEFNCTVDTTILDITTVDSTQMLNFDLDPCLTALGITLNPGDTVEFRANFTVNPDGPYPAQFKKVSNLRGYGYAAVNGIEESCDNFGDIITLAKNQTVFNFPSTSNFPEGCQETFLNYQLITVNNGFIDYFENEYRQAVGVDSFVIQFDTSVYNAFDVFEPQVSIPDHPSHGNNYFAVPAFEDFPDGRYVLHFDTLSQVPSLNNVTSYSFSFRVRVIPNCKSLTSSINGDNRFDFDPEIYFIDRYYATVIGDGSCAPQDTQSVDNDIFYEEPPTFIFNNVSSPNYDLAADTAFWEIQHCNTSFTSDAGLTWIAFEDSTDAVQIVSIEDVSDPGNIVTLPFNTYGASGSNYFAFTPGLLKGDGSAPVEDVCNTIRVKAVINKCGITDFHSKVGWNCVAYSDPLWNPEDNPPCEDIVLPLSVTTLDAVIDANIIEQPLTSPDICDTSTIAILVRNTGQGTAYDMVTELIMPFEGAEILSGSVEIAYPPSAPFVSVPTDPTFSGTTSRGRVFQYDNFALLNSYLDANGLSGFDVISPSDSNEFVIRYQFVTDCDFTNGSILYYQLQGLKSCGDSTNFETGETLPIFINGAGSGLSKIFDVEFSEESALIPGTASTIQITATNLTTTPTDTIDKILLTIPLNVEYQIGSSVALNPGSWTITEPERDTVGGFEQLYWCLPAGVLQDDSVSMSLILNSPDFTCDVDSVDVGLFTVFRQDLFCEATMANCAVESITSSNNGVMSALAVNQKILDINLTGISSFCASTTEEQMTVDGVIMNNGVDFLGTDFTIRYYHDIDGSGDLSFGDSELANFMENGPLLFGDALPFEHSFLVNSATVCNIVGVIDTIGLNLCDNSAFRIDDVQLLNAGNDVLICETAPTMVNANLGDASCIGMVGYTYQWFAVAPATTTDLSATNIADPVLTTNFDGLTEDTLVYYVETTRPGCFAVSRDTVQIILGAGVIADTGADIYTSSGSSVMLNANPAQGTLPYTYSWNPSATLDDATAAMPVATPVMDTTEYFVTVTTATGCTAIDSVLVIIGSPIGGSATGDTSICAGSTLQLMAVGGTDYEWQEDPANPSLGTLSDPNIANPIFSGGQPNEVYNFDVIVSDVAFPGFADTLEVAISVYAAPVLINPIGLLDNCSGNIQTVNIEINQNISGYNIITDGAFSGDNIFGTTLTFDAESISDTTNFSIEIFGDAAGCSVIETFQILPCPCGPSPVTSITTTDATCGNNDGAIALHLGGLEGDYQYNWTPDIGIPIGNDNERIGLPFGGYTIEIVSNANPLCTTTQEVLIQNLDGPQATVTTVAANCGVADGTATLMPVTYDYQWPDNSTANNRTDLAAGTYFVTLTDPANAACSNVIQVDIDEENNMEATVTINDSPDCGVANGSVTINVTGGVGPYFYSWSGGNDSQNNITSGVYTVTITDLGTNGCTLEYTFAVTDDVPQANITINDITDVSCHGGADGMVDFEITLDPGFAEPSNVKIFDGFNTYANGMLPAGDYCIGVRDANGCFAGQACFTISEPDPLLLLFNVTPDCDAGGTIDLEITGGTAPYVVDWDDVTGTDDPQDISDLDADNYALTVTDANNCMLTDFAEISPCSCVMPELNSILVIEATCGNSDGSATIHMVDEDSLYTYTWMPDVGTSLGLGNSRANLPFGGYVVEVASTNDPTCMTEIFVLVTNSDGPEATATTTPATCLSADGTATLNPADFLYVWEDGTNGANRNDLTTGTYFVTLTDTITNPDCPNVLMLEVEEESPLEATLTTNTNPDCGVNNGNVTIDVLNGSGTYTFNWADGFSSNNSTRDSLFSGMYTVTVADNGPTGCELEFSFLLTDDVGTATVNITDTLDVSCPDGSDGGVVFEVTYLPAFNLPADTVITDGVYFYENGMLPAGNYCMYFTDAGGCLIAGGCFEVQEPEAMDLYLVITPACEMEGCVEVSVNGGTAPFTFDWDHLVGTNDPDSICALDDGTYELVVTDANGCTIDESSVIVPSCPTDCDYFGGLDSVFVDAPSCQQRAEICFTYSLEDVLGLQILDNGVPYDLPVAGCDFDSLVVYAYSELFGQGTLGPYEVVSWSVDGETFSGEFQDIPALIDSLNNWDPTGNWKISNVGQFITGGVPNVTYSSLVINAIDFGTVSELGINFTSVPNGYQLALESGEHEIVIMDMNTGCADTLFAMVNCVDAFGICYGEEDVFCIDESSLNLSGPVTSMINVCPDLSNGSVNFEYDPGNLCVNYAALNFGTDTTCIQLCDAIGICDTVELIVTVDSCVVNTLHNIKDTIYINQTIVWCPDSTSLPGEIVSIDNYCAEFSGDYVDFFEDQSTLCLEYTGVEIGIDSACVVVCDDLGFCDTTLFCVAVIEYLDPPVAALDTICTSEGTPVVINVQANDTLFGGVDSMYISSDPIYGTVTINLDGSITYTANEEVCERTDSFYYVICTPTGCDTARVEVCIECVDIVIFTAMSPNGDGYNDVFYIANIEEYPDNKITIFNRWGNKVYEMSSYKNQWRATWNGNRDLPDGTYYYILELNDEANRVFNGYLEVHR